jgi:outer membrane protein
MIRGSLFVAALLTFVTLAPPAFAENKVGVLHTARALKESTMGKKAQEQFRTEGEKMLEPINRLREQVDKLKDDLKKKATVLSDDQKRSMADEIDRKDRESKRKLEDMQVELRKKEAETMRGLQEELAGVVDEIGKRDNYTLILENVVTVYYTEAIDITDEVIKMLDARK